MWDEITYPFPNLTVQTRCLYMRRYISQRNTETSTITSRDSFYEYIYVALGMDK